jgi:hypothetical protein
MDDAWASNDGGLRWVQFKEAFISAASGFMGRGMHAVALVSQPLQTPVVWGQVQEQLWIFGGEGGDDDTGETTFLNDVWWVDLPREPCCIAQGTCDDPDHYLTTSDIDSGCLPDRNSFKAATMDADWSPRSGHTVVVEQPSGQNAMIQRITLSGGNNKDEVFSDTWTWGFENPNYEDLFYRCDDPTNAKPYPCRWMKDFEAGQWYRVLKGSETGDV